MSEATPAKKYRRNQSASNKWHMGRESVDTELKTVYRWTEMECIDFLVEVRFGSWKTVGCPHCSSVGKHYWRPLQKRWKCAGCGSTFSITSKTVFANRKRELNDLIAETLQWSNTAAGKPALLAKRDADVTYNTVFTFQQKLREALVRGYNQGPLTGDLEMDGAHQSGRRASEKRGRPQGSRPVTAETPVEELAPILTQAGKQKAKRSAKQLSGARDPEYGSRYPKDRRIVMVVRKRVGKKGRGANGTRVAIGMAETAPEVEGILRTFAGAAESKLNTDSSPAYASAGKQFLAHRTVDHSMELSGPNGENNNQAEDFNWRFDRTEQGTYLNIEPKYMLDYGCEVAFRADTCRISTGNRLKLLLHIAMNVGLSQYWRGYTRGKHRNTELLHAGPQPAKASGPAKGQIPGAAGLPR